MLHHVGHLQHGARRHAGRISSLAKLSPSRSLVSARELGLHRRLVGEPILVGLEARIVGHLGLAQHLAQLAELAVVAGADKDVAALGREVGVGREVAVALPNSLGVLPAMK